MKPPENINPRFLRLLKSAKSSKKTEEGGEEDLFAPTTTSDAVAPAEGDSLLLLADSDEEILKWIRRKTPEPEFKAALRLFNLINSGMDPEAKIAKRLTLTVLKGTSFPDKRETCMEVVRRVRQGEHNGKILLVPSPYEDPRDPSRSDLWAMKAVADGYPKEKFLGYVPKAQGLNEVFTKSIEAGLFCGCHLINAKHTDFQNEDNQILTVVCGWVTSETP